MYESWRYIRDPIGNNEFSYQERLALWSVGESPASLGKIFVPNLIQGTLDNLEEGSEIVFEEADKGKRISCTWLKHFVQLEYKWIPVYIVDNHNHVLTFWNECRLNIWAFEHLVILHIDQHADTKPNDNICPPFKKESLSRTSCGRWCEAQEDVEDFVHTQTNVGNFITAAMNSWIINEVIQIRTDYTLHHFDSSSIIQWNIIVDIDSDFRVGKEISQEDIQIIRTMIKQAKMVTIATSPYFIDQKRAIEIIKEILQ